MSEETKSPKIPKLINDIKNENISKSESNEEDSIDSEYFENHNEALKLSEDDEEEEKEFQENSASILENIINNLEKLSKNYKNDQKLLFNILKEINIVINLLINEFTFEKNQKVDSNQNDINNFFLTEEKNKYYDNEENKNSNLDINSKIVFLLKIEILNRKISNLREEIKNLKSILFNSSNLNNERKNNIYKYLMKKFKDIKDRKKCDDFKYLIYIENLEKKIMKLEEKLNIKKHENLSKETLKSIRCFPNFVQYDFKEDINPKTIPMAQLLQKDTDNEKNKKSPILKKKKIINCLSVNQKNKKQIKPLNNTINNTIINIKNNFSRRPNELKINGITKTVENNKNIITLKDIKKNFNILSNLNECNPINSNNFQNLEKFYDSEQEVINKEYKTLNHDEKKASYNSQKKYRIKKNLIKEIKEFRPKTIMNNKKEFFVAHPTLNIAGIAKGKEQVYIGLPKKLLKLNKGGNFKSTMMVFPSSLNETMVNLEKLRNNKLHIDINKKEN